MKIEAEGASPAIVTEHVFEPRTQSVRPEVSLDPPSDWLWLSPNPYLCRHCRFAEAAHAK